MTIIARRARLGAALFLDRLQAAVVDALDDIIIRLDPGPEEAVQAAPEARRWPGLPPYLTEAANAPQVQAAAREEFGRAVDRALGNRPIPASLEFEEVVRPVRRVRGGLWRVETPAGDIVRLRPVTRETIIASMMRGATYRVRGRRVPGSGTGNRTPVVDVVEIAVVKAAGG